MTAIPARARRRLTSGAACALLALPVAVAVVAAPPASAASAGLVVSEAYGGGGNAGATLTHDFVELANPTGATVDLTGWTVRYYSAGGGLGGSTPLAGSLAARTRLLVQEARGPGGTDPLPSPDVTGSIAMGGTAGTVELLDSTGALVDRVGWGAATRAEGTPAGGTSSTSSVARKDPCSDTDDNATDLAVGTPTPQGTSAGTFTCGTTGPVPEPAARTPIADIQGTGAASPLAGTAVTTRGVVTAVYPTGGFNGFYLQTPGSGGSTDATPGASDGIFAYGSTSVDVGACVDVAGTVKEYAGLTELERITVAPATGCAAVAPTRLATLPATDADRERLEGMLVHPLRTHTITNNYQLGQFGQVGLAIGTRPLRQATDVVAPEQAPAYEAANVRKYITLDDGSSWDYLRNAAAQSSPLPYLSQDEPMRTGSHVTFTRPVILDYRYQWNYQPTGQVVGARDEQDPLRTEDDREATPPATGGDVRLASFNVLNYFTDLGAGENAFKRCPYYADRAGTPVTTNMCEVRGAWTDAAFTDQKRKLVSAVNGLHAGVVALSEIENSAGISWIDHDRDYSLRELVGELNAAGGTWAYAESPVVTAPTEDVIRTACIYDPRLVRPKRASVLLLDDAFANARYPLAQRWQARHSGTRFTTVVNHFKSKGSGADDGTGQGLSNPSREAQARALTRWVATMWPGRAVFLMGDFNAYAEETPVRIIEEAGFTNVARTYEPASATYQFAGRLGSLDHVLANRAALGMVTGAGVWDINADESIAMQYSRRNSNVVDFYTTSPFASSDHDPVVVGVDVAGSWWDRR